MNQFSSQLAPPPRDTPWRWRHDEGVMRSQTPLTRIGVSSRRSPMPEETRAGERLQPARRPSHASDRAFARHAGRWLRTWCGASGKRS